MNRLSTAGICFLLGCAPSGLRPSAIHLLSTAILLRLSQQNESFSLPHLLDKKACQCRAIVETPKGRRNKFNYDPAIQSFTLGGLLGEGLSFPFDFGFAHSTLAEDGDPVDVMILMDEPAHVGCVLDVRIIGVIEAEQTEDGKTTPNHRLVAVSTHSYNHEEIKSVSECVWQVFLGSSAHLVQDHHSEMTQTKVIGKCSKLNLQWHFPRAIRKQYFPTRIV